HHSLDPHDIHSFPTRRSSDLECIRRSACAPPRRWRSERRRDGASPSVNNKSPHACLRHERRPHIHERDLGPALVWASSNRWSWYQNGKNLRGAWWSSPCSAYRFHARSWPTRVQEMVWVLTAWRAERIRKRECPHFP